MSRPFEETSMAEVIDDTPASKRRKVYNEEDDDGDELFQDARFDSPTRYTTQPTQIIGNPSTDFGQIQVPASSPFRSTATVPSLPPTPPTQNPQQQRVGVLANMMAPAGTAFRNPNIAKKITIDLSDDDGPAYQGSSDDDTAKNANIKPSAFRRSSKTSFDSTNSLSAPSTLTNGMDKFSSIIANSIHKPGAVPSRRDPVGMLYDPRKAKTTPAIDLTKFNIPGEPSAKPRGDAMASGYGSRPKPAVQSRPERPKPIEDISIEEITDYTMRVKIERVRAVFPQHTVLACRDALLVCKGNYDDAAALLSEKDPISLVSEDEDDLPELSDLKMANTTTKRGLDKVISIKDRYGGAATAAPRKSQIEVIATPAKPKRRLMQGRKNASSPAQAPSPKPTTVVNLDSDAEGYDSGVASQSESEVDYDLEGRVLKLLNKCQPGELADLSGITKDVAEKFLAQRPFRSLNVARNTRDNSKTKGGKASTRVPMGEKIVEAAISMTRGYEAVDNLVDQCNKIARPLKAEMGKWGFNVFGGSKTGELELTSLGDEDDKDSLRDSGIGTPTSVSASQHGDAGEEEVRSSTRKDRSNKFLQKPVNMNPSIVLKDYQVVGLNWLALLYEQKLSCILADEMGLGKTCQVIAFLSHLATIGISGPHLVIVPGSTLENWLREFKQFSPGLVAEPYHGKQTERQEMADNILERRDEINVVVTTYDMAFKKQDNSFLKKLRPNVCVYDEGHLLKNPLSKRYTSLVRIPAEFRLLLTGTPLQNNLQELAALLGFILPEVFQKNYEELEFIFKHRAKTTDSDHSALLSSQRMDRARQMLAPFVLRRKKYQVLKHLPTKICRNEYCDMHPAQREIYRGYEEPARERARLRLEGAKPVPKSKAALDAKSDDNNPFMQLRKAAIHPQLFRRHFDDKKIEKMASILQKHYAEFSPDGPKGPGTGYKTEYLLQEMKGMSDFILHKWCQEYQAIKKFDIENDSWMASGKVEAMIELVKQYKANGDRVLIFSQFTKVLDILEAVLNSIDIYFTRIDGSTDISSRQPLIDQFRDDDSITAFLLTTKAGGTGLNLMMANKVIIFDASLNPQDDVQAENRAHRVGQTRDVEVVRLVTKKTIDELILKLGESKLALDRGVAGDEDSKADEAGEADVERMMLEGGLSTKDEDDTTTTDKPKPEMKSKERQASASSRVGGGRKQSIFLSQV